VKDECKCIEKIMPILCDAIEQSVQKALSEVISKLVVELSKIDKKKTDDFLDVEQAAAFLKVKKHTIYAMIKNGEIRCFQSGKRKYVFSKNDLLQFLTNPKIGAEKLK
jgi:excisionase family DNA binding protein